MNLPDRFDVYSIGFVFLQMAFPSLRTVGGLIQFNLQLKRCGYNIAAWRKTVETCADPELGKGFELLDLDGGSGRELLMSTEIVQKKGNVQRNSLASALRLQRKIVRTLNESMIELNRQRKSLWWGRWIPWQE